MKKYYNITSAVDIRTVIFENEDGMLLKNLNGKTVWYTHSAILRYFNEYTEPKERTYNFFFDSIHQDFTMSMLHRPLPAGLIRHYIGSVVASIDSDGKFQLKTVKK